MELFKENGHLTQQALHALTGDSLDELERLEAGEHLSFCDECLTAYLAVLESTELLAPAEPMAGKVLKAAKRKGRTVAFARYTSVAAAAVLATALWSTGLLSSLTGALAGAPAGSPGPGAPTGETTQTATLEDLEADQPRAPLGTRFDNALANVNNYFNRVLGGTSTRRDTQEEPEEPDERAQREALFETDATSPGSED